MPAGHISLDTPYGNFLCFRRSKQSCRLIRQGTCCSLLRVDNRFLPNLYTLRNRPMAMHKASIFSLFASLLLYSCTMVDSTLQKVAGPDAETGPKVYYAGKPDLKMYSGPSFSHPCVCKLPLNEKVIRYKVKNGLAYVSATSTGRQGWVNNGHLLWKPVVVTKSPASNPTSSQAVPAAGESKPRNPSLDAGIQGPSMDTGVPCPDRDAGQGRASSFDAF